MTRHSISSHSCESSNPPEDEKDASLQLIETQSEPDYASIRDSLAEDSPGKARNSICSDNSFLHLEEMVSKLCMPTENKDYNELDNTLEEVEYILKHGPGQMTNDNKDNDDNNKTSTNVNTDQEVKNECIFSEDKQATVEAPPATITSAPPHSSRDIIKVETCINPIETEENFGNIVTSNELKPGIEVKHQNTLYPDEINHCAKKGPLANIPGSHTPTDNQPFRTPCKDAISKTPVFKTPASTLMLKKPSTSSVNKKTPVKSGQYAHIASPVACYIKNSPQVPLVQDVRPKKPLPGCSSNIPKLIHSKPKTNVCNKENVNLPSLAYIGAKKTKMVRGVFVLHKKNLTSLKNFNLFTNTFRVHLSKII